MSRNTWHHRNLQSLEYESTWWRIFQKCVLRTKLDINVSLQCNILQFRYLPLSLEIFVSSDHSQSMLKGEIIHFAKISLSLYIYIYFLFLISATRYYSLRIWYCKWKKNRLLIRVTTNISALNITTSFE